MALLIGGATVSTGTAAAATSSYGPSYYLSVGDSLALGVQPDASTGEIRPTSNGYADVLHQTLVNSTDPGLRLVKLGCSYETSATFINGGICQYDQGKSQLAAAEKFLKEHSGNVRLVTINIGGNDIVGCASAAGIDEACRVAALSTLRTNLTKIAARLRAAAGPNVRIVGANAQDPYLAFWFNGPEGQQLAQDSLTGTAEFNNVVSDVFAPQKIQVADVATAFDTFDTSPVPVPDLGDVPLNVLRICQYTFLCTPAPQGPDGHLTDEGYRVMSGAFATKV